MTDHHDEEIERLTALGARPLNEINLPAVRLGEDLYLVRQTTFAVPEGSAPADPDARHRPCS